jgi:hypothetical protein
MTSAMNIFEASRRNLPWCAECERVAESWRDLEWCLDGRLRCAECVSRLREVVMDSEAARRADEEKRRLEDEADAKNAKERSELTRDVPQRLGPEKPNPDEVVDPSAEDNS